MNDETGKTEGGGQATGFDIPDNDLTPSVQAALCRIIEEIDLLRADTERS